jgi:hypothetical protein
MTMKKILSILILLAFMAGCEKEDLVLSERDKIEKYLNSTRGMIIAADTIIGDKKNPPFYDLFIRSKPNRYAFRHIINYYAETDTITHERERNSKPRVEMGDKIDIRFNAYTFTGSKPDTAAIYWSNIPEVIKSLERNSAKTLDWSTEPLQIELGKTEILEGLELALAEGCREKDSVQIYMTSNLAYGKNWVGVVPKNSMVKWFLIIEKVTK